MRWLDVLFILILSLTPLLWFKEGMVMVGHDNVFPLSPLEFFKGRLFTWTEQNFGQDQSLIMGTIPIHLLDILPQKLVYIFWFFLIGFSAYILARTINRQSRFFQLMAVVFYQFNFFLLQGWWIGERTKFSAYIALPLFLAVLIRLLRKEIGPLKAAAFNSLILFFFNVGGLFGIPLYGGFFISVAIFIFYFSWLSFRQKKYFLIKNLILTSVLSLIGFFLINAYYLLPALHQFLAQYQGQMKGVGGKSGLLSWAEVISVGTSFVNLFRLQGMADWYDSPGHPYAHYFLQNPWLIIISFIWPFLSFSAPILIKRKKKLKFVFYFLLVYLVGIFFAAGTHPPLGFLYRFFIKTIPGFAIFRTPFYKFAPALFIASAFLGAFTLDWFKEKMAKTKTREILFCSFWLVLVLVYHFPYFQAEFFSFNDHFSTRLKVPEYVFGFGRWINEEKKDDLRILVLPQLNEDRGYDLYRWGYLSLFPLAKLLTNQSVLLNDETLNSSERQLLRLAYKSLLNNDQKLFEKLASILRLGYILVRNDYYYDLDWAKTENPLSYHFDFPKVKEFDQWELYKIPDYQALPQVYGITEPNIVAASWEDFAKIYSLEEITAEEFIFVENADLKDFSVQAKYYLFPSCLSCQIEAQKTEVQFPAPIFLPDSLFYFFTQLKEKLEKGDPLGYSLKRLIELERTLRKVQKKDEDKIKAIHLYRHTLGKIEKSFFEIQGPDEKLLAAEKLAVYLEAEDEKLVDVYGESMSQGVKAEFEQTTWQLHLLRGKIKPYLFNQDFSTNKLFSFYLPQEERLRLLVEKEAIIGLKIDDGLVMTEYEPKDNWLDFGEYTFSQGNHHILLIVPSGPSLLSQWQLVEKISATGLKNCFLAKIENFSPQEKYEVNLVHYNTLFDDLFYFQKEEKGEKEEGFFRPETQMDLNVSFKVKKNKFLIFPYEETREVELGFCGRDLTEESLRQIVKKIEVKKLIAPTLFLKPVDKGKSQMVDLAFQETNPTKFSLSLQNVSSSFILVFLERFNPGWQLSPPMAQRYSQPFVYANSWLIEKIDDGEFVLEYLPQKWFYQGIVFSMITFILAVMILKFKKEK